MLCRLNLILNCNQGLALFKQKQILWSTSHKHLQKQNNKDFFIQLFNAWLRLTNNNLPAPPHHVCKRNSWPTHIFKFAVQSDNLFSIASHPGKFQTNLLLFIRDLCACRCLQSSLITSTTFGEKLDFSTANHEKVYKFIMDLIPNDWKYLKLKLLKKTPF